MKNILSKKRAILALSTLSSLFTTNMSFALNYNDMFDVKKLDRTKEWTYSPNSTTVIGVPFVQVPIQVTYDGAIYSRNGELCFFYGKDLTPVLANQKTFVDGYIPITTYTWIEDDIEYNLESFAAVVKPLNAKNAVAFAKLSMKNLSKKETKEAQIAAAFRGTVGHFRKGKSSLKCVPETKFSINDNKLIIENSYKNNRNEASYFYSFSPENVTVESVPGVKYSGTYQAKDYYLTQRAASAFSIYRKKLAPNETFSATFRMPKQPIKDMSVAKTVANSDYNIYRAKTVDYWQNLLKDKTTFDFPEQRVNNAWRGSLTHLILATRDKGSKRQGSGLPYDSLFLNDYVDMRYAYDNYGLTEFVDVNTPWLLKQQLKDGMFFDVALSHGNKKLASHGQALFSMAHHYVLTRDEKYLKQVYPTLKKGTDWVVNQHLNNKNGLMPPSWPYDNEMIKGCYTSHNLWALLGLRNAVRVARLANKTDDATRWEKAAISYEDAIQKAIDWTVKDKGYVATGLYKYITGPAARRGFAEYRTAQDWENNLLVYPSEVLSSNDLRVKHTLNFIKWRKYREGIMTYRNGQHLHQYITLNQANNFAIIGETEQALTDFYNVLLHSGAMNEGFENLTIPWSNRTAKANCPPPHAWAAAKIALFVRNMLVLEHGGKAGLNEKERGVYLYNVVSPEWAQKGNIIKINNAVSEFGLINSEMKFTGDGAEISFAGPFKNKTNFIAIRVPYFVKLNKFYTDAKKAEKKNNVIFLSSDATKLTLKWVEDGEKFANTTQKLLKDYRAEFGFEKDAKRYTEANRSKAFLTDSEIHLPPRRLSFATVTDAFTK
ncbi:hypothetical protein AAEX28_05775 [Lentisphaerota bacterium WC36G]|nr:hypothetical protein LJT99_08635 [Lentisphaerae bacterium WC36]